MDKEWISIWNFTRYITVCFFVLFSEVSFAQYLPLLKGIVWWIFSKKFSRRISKIETFLRPNMFLFFSNSTYNLEKNRKKIFRRTPNLFPELRTYFPNSELISQTQIWSSGNKLGIREINSEFGKSIRSSVNHFGVRRKISGIIHYCAMLAELRIVCPGKQIWSSGNKFGVRKINSEFGK